MVMNGVGAAIVSALAVQREVASGDLVRIPIVGLDLRPQLAWCGEPTSSFHGRLRHSALSCELKAERSSIYRHRYNDVLDFPKERGAPAGPLPARRNE